MKKKYDYYKLHVEGRDGDSGRYVVKGYGSYEKHSVNYGMTMISFLDSFSTEAEAREAYPELPKDGSEYSNKFMDPPTDPGPIAPGWFDPTIAGERWDEDY